MSSILPMRLFSSCGWWSCAAWRSGSWFEDIVLGERQGLWRSGNCSPRTRKNTSFCMVRFAMLRKPLVFAASASLCLLLPCPVPAQSIQDRLQGLMNTSNGAWTEEQVATMARLRDAAMQDPYALTELRHLTDNIGPRLSGSPQAQKAVDYVAAEMRVLGADVQLEKTSVPHWVRGAETGELVSWPGMADGTNQKIVLTALGGSVTTNPEGLVADVVVA